MLPSIEHRVVSQAKCNIRDCHSGAACRADETPAFREERISAPEKPRSMRQPLRGWVLAERADDTGGIAKSKAARRQVVRHDAAGTDDAPVADGDTGQYDRPAADPDAVADADRPGIFEPGGTG